MGVCAGRGLSALHRELRPGCAVAAAAAAAGTLLSVQVGMFEESKIEITNGKMEITGNYFTSGRRLAAG